MMKRHTDDAVKAFDDQDILLWLLRQPAIKAQAYFWNYSSRTERRKAIARDMKSQEKEPT